MIYDISKDPDGILLPKLLRTEALHAAIRLNGQDRNWNDKYLIVKDAEHFYKYLSDGTNEKKR